MEENEDQLNSLKGLDSNGRKSTRRNEIRAQIPFQTVVREKLKNMANGTNYYKMVRFENFRQEIDFFDVWNKLSNDSFDKMQFPIFKTNFPVRRKASFFQCSY